MFSRKSTLTLFALTAIVLFGTAAIKPRGKAYKNLKVLPQDISEQRLDSLMNAYNKALKVSCDFCHAPAKNNFPLTTAATDNLDFALDNEMKENARRMIRMTIDINTSYFRFDSTTKPAYLNVVTCNTCHRGNPFPVYE